MAKTLSSVLGGVVPTNIPSQDGSLSGGTRRDMQLYDNDTFAKRTWWGPRFQWATAAPTPITSAAWSNILSLTGPGVLEFLGAWLAGGVSNEDVNLRILIDGGQALHMGTFKISSTDAGDGFVLVGDSQLAGATVNNGDTKIFDSIRFESELKVQLQAVGADVVGDSYRLVYRSHST